MIPKRIRDRLGIRPGDEVAFAPTVEGAELRPVRRGTDLRGILADSDVDVLAAYEARKKLDLEAEERDLPPPTREHPG